MRLPGALPLRGPLQHAAWGSREDLARLERRPYPTREPEAERWYGTYPDAPARILLGGDWIALDEALAAAPAAHLGTDAPADALLPILVKILAVARPLSLQVHPDAAAAADGYRRAARSPGERRSGGRTFVDPWPKPEVLLALSSFEAVCGFASPAVVRARLARFGDPTGGTLAALMDQGAPGARSAAAALLGLPREQVRRAVADLAACTTDARAAAHPDAPAGEPAESLDTWIARLATSEPDDPAVLLLLLLDHHRLAPGEVLEVPPGTPHAYLHGVGLEVMVPSDNVVRAGWTRKPIDPVAFVAHLGAAPGATSVRRLRSRRPGCRRTLSTDAPPVSIDLLGPGDGRFVLPPSPAPQIVLALDGTVWLDDQDSTLSRPAGAAAYLPVTGRSIEARLAPGARLVVVQVSEAWRDLPVAARWPRRAELEPSAGPVAVSPTAATAEHTRR